MSEELAARTREVVLASPRALTSSEIAVRLRVPRPDTESALDALRADPALVVREWPMADPHFGLDQIVVAAAVDPAAGASAERDAELRCQQVFDDLLREFLASHRCV